MANALSKLGVTRLAHFTPALNLPHILADGCIRSSKDLASQSPEYFSPTDRNRFDSHPDKVCCSFEYPNPYYLAQAAGKPDFTNYRDWVCLLLDITLVLRPGVLFCPYNAATGRGAYAHEGGDALLACFRDRVGTWERGSRHHPKVATDLQAEVLVPGPIELSYLRGIVVPSAEAAQEEWGRLRLLGVSSDGYPWVVAPTFFRKLALSSRLRFGGVIRETKWQPPQDGT
ncbi:DarT ssDNA thymidine ADP-ribosyltransferase family protein [Microbispora bryophytorum]|uniref:DarT ssDNA thymidine ADP-ribosyltransferase family protein n=1 Tax=Microbispora bryophytorum TaxID=1460882 RepID=UPI0033CDD6A7